MINYLNDSDGEAYQVCAQTQFASCAAAAMWMAESEVKQMSLKESEWNKMKQIYQGVVSSSIGPQTFDPRQHNNDQNTFGNQFSQAGTFYPQVKNALLRQGLNVTVGVDNTPLPNLLLLKNQITRASPEIVLLGWYQTKNGQLTRNGGHFIVAAKVNSRGQIVYLDPWGGRLVESPNNGQYPGGGRMEVALYVSRR